MVSDFFVGVDVDVDVDCVLAGELFIGADRVGRFRLGFVSGGIC